MNGIWLRFSTLYCDGLVLAREIIVSTAEPCTLSAAQDGGDNAQCIVATYKTRQRAAEVFEEICGCLRRGQSYYEVPRE